MGELNFFEQNDKKLYLFLFLLGVLCDFVSMFLRRLARSSSSSWDQYLRMETVNKSFFRHSRIITGRSMSMPGLQERDNAAVALLFNTTKFSFKFFNLEFLPSSYFLLEYHHYTGHCLSMICKRLLQLNANGKKCSFQENFRNASLCKRQFSWKRCHFKRTDKFQLGKYWHDMFHWYIMYRNKLP